MAYRPVTYHWKDKARPQGPQGGLIAQEVQTIDPSLVNEGNVFGSAPFHAFADWRWTFVKSSEDIQGSVTFEVKVAGSSLTENSGTWQSGWGSHKNCSVKMTTTTNADQEIYGQLTLEGRYIHDTSITVSKSVTCNLVIISEN